MSDRQYRRGQVNVVVQMVVFIAAVGLLAVLAYRQIDRILNPSRLVAVLNTDLKAGEAIQPEQIALTSVRSGSLPASVLEEPGDAVGRTLVRGKKAGDPLFPSDFSPLAAKPGTPLSSQVPAGRVVTTLTLTHLTVPYRELKGGDRIDVLVAGAGPDRRRTAKVMVRDAIVLGYLAAPTPRTPPRRGLLGALSGNEPDKKVPPGLMLAVLPSDVPALAEIQGSGAPLTLALHSRQSVESGERLRIARTPEARAVEVITGADRETVTVYP
jgi:Flp pilus assembly protein CpaB